MFRKLWEWIKRPHGFGLILFYILTAGCIAAAILFTILGLNKGFGITAYIFYALAAITLGYTVYSIVIYIPIIKRRITEKLKTNPFMANMMENYDYKTAVFTIISFGITMAFALMNLVGALRYRTIWYGAIAAYYFGLVLFRGGVLLANNACAKKFAYREEKYEKCKWRIHLASGAFLTIIEFAMIIAITQMMLSQRPMQSGMIMAITNAVYTFFKVTMAIVNLVKAQKSRNPVTQSLRNLNFADACMSIVSLTVLMISTFDDDSSTAMPYVKALVGFVVCIILIAIASAMIIRSSKKLKSFKEESTDEQR